MSNFESIDDYLSNRLSDADKSAFEQQLASDPSLKADMDLQKRIIEGVQNARRLELKSMLSNIPVGGSMGGAVSAGKIAASVIVAGIVGTGIYFLAAPSGSNAVKNDIKVEKTNEADKADAPVTEAVPAVQDVTKTNTPAESLTPAAPSEKKQQTTQAASKTTTPATQQVQPKIDVVDPSEEMSGNAAEEKSTVSHSKANTNNTRIAVDTDSSNKQYNFHYQFAGNRLMLYGPFDKTLYEILEINGDQKSVFLFYKDSYYLLNDKQQSIKKLEPITDPVLIKKLKEYKG